MVCFSGWKRFQRDCPTFGPSTKNLTLFNSLKLAVGFDSKRIYASDLLHQMELVPKIVYIELSQVVILIESHFGARCSFFI